MPADTPLESQQRLRLQRFYMAVGTYAVVIITTFLTVQLGFGWLDTMHLILIIGLAVLINLVFFALLATGANLRFSDPSLTWVQILISGFWGLIAIHYLWEVRPLLLMFYVPAFSFGMLRLGRRQYLSLVACVMGLYALLLVLEFLQGREGFALEYELLVFAIFGVVLTWFAFFGGFISDIRRRLRVQKEAVQRANEEINLEVEERKRAQIEKDTLIVELQGALSKVKTLSGLLPICASCKKIRDDRGYWNQLESYIRSHSEADFSHSICPDCARRMYGDITRRRKPE